MSPNVVSGGDSFPPCSLQGITNHILQLHYLLCLRENIQNCLARPAQSIPQSGTPSTAGLAAASHMKLAEWMLMVLMVKDIPDTYPKIQLTERDSFNKALELLKSGICFN